MHWGSGRLMLWGQVIRAAQYLSSIIPIASVLLLPRHKRRRQHHDPGDESHRYLAKSQVI